MLMMDAAPPACLVIAPMMASQQVLLQPVPCFLHGPFLCTQDLYGGATLASGPDALGPAPRPDPVAPAPRLDLVAPAPRLDPVAPAPRPSGDPKKLCRSAPLCEEAMVGLRSPEQRSGIIQWIAPVAADLSLAKASCKVVQLAIEVGSRPDQEALAKGLEGHTMKLWNDPQGNHVLQQAINSIPKSVTGFIPKEMVRRAVNVAKHKYGCRVLQRLFEIHSLEDASMAAILEELVAEAQWLATDPFGNFVIQKILEVAPECPKRLIVGAILPNLVEVAQNRGGSCVVEKALLYCHGLPEIRQKLVGELRKSAVAVASTKYGSFVVEKLADKDDDIHKELLAGMPELKKTEFGLKVAAHLAPAAGA